MSLKAKLLVDRIDRVKMELFLKAVRGDEEALKKLIELSRRRLDKISSVLNKQVNDDFIIQTVNRFKSGIKDEVIGHIIANYFSRLSPSLIDAGIIRNPRSIIMLGAPGVGKSERVFQAGSLITNVLNIIFKDDEEVLRYVKLTSENAGEIVNNPDKYFVIGDVRLVYYSDPSELRGIPTRLSIGDKHIVVADIPTVFTYTLSRVPGILFLDELTNADEATLNASFQIILDHMIGFHKYHDDVIVVGAGNTKEYSRLASDLPTPLLTRADVKRISPPKLDEWFKYMEEHYRDAWDKRVYAYLKLKAFEKNADPPVGIDGLIVDPKSFVQIRAKQTPYPCPRSWTEFAVKLKTLEDIYGFDVLDRIIEWRKRTAGKSRDYYDENDIIISEIERTLSSIIGEEAYESFISSIEGLISIQKLVIELYEYGGDVLKNQVLLDRALKMLKDYPSQMVFAIVLGLRFVNTEAGDKRGKVLLINAFRIYDAIVKKTGDPSIVRDAYEIIYSILARNNRYLELLQLIDYIVSKQLVGEDTAKVLKDARQKLEKVTKLIDAVNEA